MDFNIACSAISFIWKLTVTSLLCMDYSLRQYWDRVKYTTEEAAKIFF